MKTVRKQLAKKKSWWKGWLIVGGLVVVGGGLIGVQVRQSRLIGKLYRFNLVIASEAGGVEFVSIDPVEKEVVRMKWPSKLAIKSRSVGSYQVGELYQLGAYDQRAGEFVRQKVQGFMKIPVMGYVTAGKSELSGAKSALWQVLWKKRGVKTSLSYVDAWVLWGRLISYRERAVSTDELVRAGILVEVGDEGYEYQPGRLQQYLGTRVVEWGVGQTGLTAVVLNESGMTGLAGDIADFFGNVGIDVVAVRNGEESREHTEIIIGEMEAGLAREVREMFVSWFGWERFVEQSTSESRADMVVKLGKDAEQLF